MYPNLVLKDNQPKMDIITLTDLMRAKYPEPRWVVKDFLPEGIATLGGRPKVGKSWLGMDLGLAVATGKDFLSLPVEKGPVLYLALEDSKRRFQERMRAMGAEESDLFHLAIEWPSFDDGGMEQLLDTMDEIQPRLVIVDTIARAYRSAIDWNDYGKVTALLSPLQSVALQRGTCVLFIDHHSKPKGNDADPVDDLLGSTGKAGVMDTLMGLYRKENKSMLYVVGREVERHELRLEWDAEEFRWDLHEDSRQILAQATDDKTLAVLRRIGPATARAVGEALGVKRQRAWTILERLVTQGQAIYYEEKTGRTTRKMYRAVGG